MGNDLRDDSFVFKRQYLLNDFFPIAHNQLKRMIKSYRVNKEIRLGRGSAKVNPRGVLTGQHLEKFIDFKKKYEAIKV